MPINRWPKVGATLTRRMKNTNLRLADVVRISGVNDATVRGILRGEPRGEPDDATKGRISEALGGRRDTIDRLLAGQAPIWRSDPAPTPTADHPSSAAVTPALAHQLTASVSDRLDAYHAEVMEILTAISDALTEHRLKVEPDDGVDNVLDRLTRAVETVASQRQSPPPAPGTRRRG